MLVYVLASLVYVMSLVLAGIVGYFYGVRVTMDYYNKLLSKPTSSRKPKMDDFDKDLENALSKLDN